MLSGLNTDVEYQGKVYHVQTEDGGKSSPSVVTTLFSSGAILTQRKTSYSDKVGSNDLRNILKDLMNEQHRRMIDDLRSGRIPQVSGSAVPGPSRVMNDPSPRSSSKKQPTRSLDDLILDYLANKEEKDN